MQFILLTGLSGAGKTTSLRYLEDMGCPYVDNLPPAMASRFIELWQASAPDVPMAVLATDIRSGNLFDAHALAGLIAAERAAGVPLRVLFLEASDEALLNRFKETRREHPLAAQAGSLPGAIALERERMQPLRETADIVVETTALRARDLRERLTEALALSGVAAASGLRAELLSFGFKRGIPRDADLVLDVRFLPNPFYIDTVRFQTGLEAAARDYVLSAPVTKAFLEKTTDLLLFLMPHYQAEGKRRLVVAIGCTGGAQRSVAICEALAERLRRGGYPAGVTHRDIAHEKEYWKQL